MKKAGKQGIQKVLDFIPFFENKKNVFVKSAPDTSSLDYTYSKEVSDFIKCLYKTGIIQPFDWTMWQEETKKYVKTPSLMEKADLLTIQKLFTTHIRKERFCSGHLAAMIENGHILMLLIRLKQIFMAFKQEGN